MENFFLLLATGLVLRIPSPKFRRCFIGRTGCTVLLFAGKRSFKVHCTNEGDKVYFNEYSNSDVTYGMICIQLNRIYSIEQTGAILKAYLQKAKKPFQIACSDALKFEENKGNLTGSAYWQDEEGKDWKIRSYASDRILSLLYVRNIGATTVAEHDRFLDGFRFRN